VIKEAVCNRGGRIDGQWPSTLDIFLWALSTPIPDII
jgi:hypothetical protein